MVHCQIIKSAAAGCMSWPLWGGATSVYFPVSRWKPYPDVEGCLVISFVQVLTNLVDVRCIKCTCKGGNWTSFSGKKEEDNEYCSGLCFGQSSFQSFRFRFLSIELLINPKCLQLSPWWPSIGTLKLRAFYNMVLGFGFCQFNT
jgi:hypothetical protein